MDLVPQLNKCQINLALDDSESDEEKCEETVIDTKTELHTDSKISIDNSNDVVIGPVTQIHGPITIYQNVPELESSSQNHVEKKGKFYSAFK